jgi:hypothetical protein
LRLGERGGFFKRVVFFSRGGGWLAGSPILIMSQSERVTNMITALSLLTEAEMKMNIGLKAVIAIAPQASQ